jgi:hypothetical protein
MLQQPAVPASTVTYQNQSGQTAYVTVIGGTVTSINVNAVQVATATNFTATVPNGQTIAITYSAVPVWYWSTFTPAVPASGVWTPNPTGQDITVVLASGTVTHVTINGPATPATDRATSSPANVMLPAGGSIQLTYSAVPVWAWLNFFNLDLMDSLGDVYANNNSIAPAGVAGYSEYTSLPYAQHPTGGMSGFATGVSN